MSCRTTPSGSLGTTYIVQQYGLTDAQSTSLYHELVREYNNTDPLERAPVSDEDYYNSAHHIERQVLSSPHISERMAVRLLGRVNRVRSHAAPADEARRYALTAIDVRARQAQRAISVFVSTVAVATNVPESEVQDRFNRHVRSRRVGRSHDFEPAVLPGMPQDAGTAFAVQQVSEWAAEVRGREQCETCGQWHSSQVPHNCPNIQQQEQSTPASRQFGSNADDQTVDMAQFQEMYDAIASERASGITRLASLSELELEPGGVTGGLGAPGSGMSFGIELEVDFPDEEEYEWGESRDTLARMMYEEGIGLSPRFQRWHFVGDEGANRPGGEFETRPDGWVCEFDRSVDDVQGARGVEIKSQILYDEPATWANLRRICEIVEQLGGKATPRCGLHVNVGGADLSQDDPTFHTNLVRLTRAYDDVMVRMAHNPESGPTHRGRQYCAPAHLPPAGYRTVQEARAYANHYQAVNLSRVPDVDSPANGSSRVEVRLFDSSLDPNRIQAQVAMSLALVNAAKHNDPDTERDPMLAGTQRSRFGRRRLEGEEWEQATEPIRAFLSLMKRNGLGKSEQREQFTRLFSASRWQSS